MAHNWSMHKVMRERAKEGLSAYAAWVVVASCGTHGVWAYAVARLRELAAPLETLGAMAGRLQCPMATRYEETVQSFFGILCLAAAAD
jgi:hypothetical protein